MNTCVLTGNLGGDPDIHFSQNGEPVANFNLAFRAGKKKTGWIRVTAFNKLAVLILTLFYLQNKTKGSGLHN